MAANPKDAGTDRRSFLKLAGMGSVAGGAALVAGTVAGFSGPWLLVTLGVPALAWSSGLAVAVALAIVLLLVREQPEAQKA